MKLEIEFKDKDLLKSIADAVTNDTYKNAWKELEVFVANQLPIDNHRLHVISVHDLRHKMREILENKL